jgi:hypothetical protein
MRRYRPVMPALLGLSLVMRADLAPEAVAAAAEAQTPASAPGMARVWFLRPAESSSSGFGTTCNLPILTAVYSDALRSAPCSWRQWWY